MLTDIQRAPPRVGTWPDRVSPQSAISRFRRAVGRLSEPFLDHLLDLREGQREAVIALDGRGIRGVARFARDPEEANTAEVAVLVAHEWQHRGGVEPDARRDWLKADGPEIYPRLLRPRPSNICAPML